MNIDCLLVLKDESNHLPTSVSFWVDPYWCGKWVKGQRGEDPSTMLFHVQYVLEPVRQQASLMRCASLQKMQRKLNSSAKVQFFMPKEERTDKSSLGDFRYSCVFPLNLLWARGGSGWDFGVWNPNHREQCDKYVPSPLLGVQLKVVPRSPMGPIPHGIKYLQNQEAPSLERHQGHMDVARWLSTALHDLYTNEPTTFFYMRTYGRNPYSDMFFFDAYQMYGAKGTNLPPTLALYALCNALSAQGLGLGRLEEILGHTPQNKEEINVFLALMRDILMCFTFCPVEGKYRPDLSDGQVIEDQPNLFSFTEEGTTTVFAEDDCEGRNQQGCVHIRELFCSIARDFREHGGLHVMEHFEEHPLLRVSKDTLARLLGVAHTIGELFHTGHLNALMVQGDCNFTQFTATPTAGGQLDGHSFGILLYQGDEDALQGSVVLENTGNEARRRRTQMPTVEEALALKELLPLMHGLDDVAGFQNCMLAQSENDMYVKVFVGNHTIFFTHHEDGRMEFGASPSQLNTRYVVYGGESPSEALEWGHAAVLVHPMKLMEAMRDGKGLWPQRAEADRVCATYKRLDVVYPSIRRVLMPPQDTEAEYMRRMELYWGAIEEEQLDLGKEHRKSRGIIVSVVRDLPVPSGLARWMDRQDQDRPHHSRHFMQSTLYQYFYD